MNRPGIRVTMSTASAFPETTETSFAMAAQLGYDGVELMVLADPVTQDADALRRLIDRHQLPIVSIHSPCLLITSRVWSSDPLVKLARSLELAERVDAPVVVIHPPFVWQRAAAADFPAAVAELQSRTPVKIAVENMFPVSVGARIAPGRLTVNTYRPHWNPVWARYQHYTLDLSHTATSHTDAMALAQRMGDELAHLHLADGSGSPKDEHLVPGRGTQPCTEMLEHLVRNDFRGAVCVEISTRGVSRARRVDDLARSLTFARLALEPTG
ncbi:MAG: sugar phosphate isomerase/epimerase [Actinomycetota bacterium]|nr:sugar phosphate isomerase/epimerase [Actinomycetota bacterium]